MYTFIALILIISLSFLPVAIATEIPFYLRNLNDPLPQKRVQPKSILYIPGKIPYADWAVKRAAKVSEDIAACYKELEFYSFPKNKKEEVEKNWILVKINKKSEYLKFLDKKFLKTTGTTMADAGYLFDYFPSQKVVVVPLEKQNQTADDVVIVDVKKIIEAGLTPGSTEKTLAESKKQVPVSAAGDFSLKHKKEEEVVYEKGLTIDEEILLELESLVKEFTIEEKEDDSKNTIVIEEKPELKEETTPSRTESNPTNPIESLPDSVPVIVPSIVSEIKDREEEGPEKDSNLKSENDPSTKKAESLATPEDYRELKGIDPESKYIETDKEFIEEATILLDKSNAALEDDSSQEVQAGDKTKVKSTVSDGKLEVQAVLTTPTQFFEEADVELKEEKVNVTTTPPETAPLLLDKKTVDTIQVQEIDSETKASVESKKLEELILKKKELSKKAKEQVLTSPVLQEEKTNLEPTEVTEPDSVNNEEKPSIVIDSEPTKTVTPSGKIMEEGEIQEANGPSY